jgi:hypothetical protein
MLEGRDYVFFFGYVQLSADERKYSAAKSGSAQKLSDINGEMKSAWMQRRRLILSS